MLLYTVKKIAMKRVIGSTDILLKLPERDKKNWARVQTVFK
jgi:hypothetical protein